MPIAYLDAFSGIAGDMTLGALVHAGLPLALLQEVPGRLGLAGVEVRAERRLLNGIACTKVSVVDTQETSRSGHRSLVEILRLIDDAGLRPRAREAARMIFHRLAEAEGHVHGIAPEAVHFHEVGAVDSLVDVIGAAVGFDALQIEHLYASPLPVGRGRVQTRHGTLPVPAPATLEVLRGWPVRLEDGTAELVTPTGAAIVAALARPEPPPELRVEAVGYGCGDLVFPDRPNVLRIVIGEIGVPLGGDEVVCLEANLDDCTPELLGHAMERLLAAGARDVFLTPIQMKKNRPGSLLRVLADPVDRDRLARIVFAETSTIGVRYSVLRRHTLPRESVDVETGFGRIAVRIARSPDGTVNVAPEFESCRRAAEAAGVPVKQVFQAAIAGYEHTRR